MNLSTSPLVGLVSMPWMEASMPSIQLATLATALQREGIASESYEFYLDYAADIGLNLYRMLSDSGGFIEEWIFAQHYFEAEKDDTLSEFRANRPQFGFESVELEDQILDALIPVTANFLEDITAETDWSSFDVIGFSLTISQVASSMALARMIKKRNPDITIVFGGAGCAGPMGSALLKICPYVDLVVHIEGEQVFPELVRRVCNGQSLEGLQGISWRDNKDNIITNPGGRLFTERDNFPPLRFDAYFKRLKFLGLDDKLNVWLPFESSRGCWYGQKVQCNFCGLHEIMKFRTRSWECVLAELEELHERYGISQFFAVDLIMPREFFKTLLPEISRRGYKWSIFYEVKANMKREEVEILAKAGVRWIQPGIESLNDRTLKLMRKGVSSLQNIQLLKWCQELDIRTTWNILLGTPGERDGNSARMAKLMRQLFHLMPPSGASPIQLHRFSPYFEQPEEFGIKPLGPHRLYKYIFPVQEEDLRNLVYRYEYTTKELDSLNDYAQLFHEVIEDWKDAQNRGASLNYYPLEDGSAEILDTRQLPGTFYRLSASECCLYVFLESVTNEKTFVADFKRKHPLQAQEICKRLGIVTLIDRWKKQGLVVSNRGCLLAVAVNAGKAKTHYDDQSSKLTQPFVQLNNITKLEFAKKAN